MIENKNKISIKNKIFKENTYDNLINNQLSEGNWSCEQNPMIIIGFFCNN